MGDKESSYFYYPTTSIIIDDDNGFLESFKLSLNLKGDQLIKTFVDPMKALSHLEKQDSIYRDYQNYLDVIEGIETDSDDKDKISKVNFNGICRLPYSEKRYNEISVIIVDYFMPKINGIDFFKEIKENPAKKILLTGNTDYKLAVNAFNDGLIDKFIIKEDGLDEKIHESIKTFKKKYFQEFSETLLLVFDKGIKKASQYNSIASSWRSKHQITEYYQCDGNGSCLGFDNAKSIHWLLICSDKDMHDYISVAENSDGGSLIANELKLKTKLLFFFSDKEQLSPVVEWNKHTFPVSGDFIVDNKKYFYSLVSNKELGIDLKRVAMLQQ